MTQPKASLAEQFKALEKIQEMDLRIDRLRKEKASQPAALKSLDDAIAKAQSAVTVRRSAVDVIEKGLRQARAGLELNRDRLQRSNQRLEGIQNSNEFDAVNREIEQLNRQSRTLEEQAMKSEAEMAAARGELEKLEAKVADAMKAKASEAARLSVDTGKVDQEIASLLSQRAEIAPAVEPRVLASYDKVRVARGGLGFVTAAGGRCLGCNMAVPPQLFNEISKATAVHPCPSCHRILFPKV